MFVCFDLLCFKHFFLLSLFVCHTCLCVYVVYVWRTELDNGYLLWLSISFLKQGLSLNLGLATVWLFLYHLLSTTILHPQDLLGDDLPVNYSPSTPMFCAFDLVIPVIDIFPRSMGSFQEATPPYQVAPSLLSLFLNAMHVVLLLLL